MATFRCYGGVMSEADSGPKSDAAAPAPARVTEAEKKDRWVAAALLGLAFALSLVVPWQSGKVAEEQELQAD
jgi:hypothetical protein